MFHYKQSLWYQRILVDASSPSTSRNHLTTTVLLFSSTIEDISTMHEEELPSVVLIVLLTSSVGKTIYKAYTALPVHRRP